MRDLCANTENEEMINHFKPIMLVQRLQWQGGMRARDLIVAAAAIAATFAGCAVDSSEPAGTEDATDLEPGA